MDICMLGFCVLKILLTKKPLVTNHKQTLGHRKSSSKFQKNKITILPEFWQSSYHHLGATYVEIPNERFQKTKSIRCFCQNFKDVTIYFLDLLNSKRPWWLILSDTFWDKKTAIWRIHPSFPLPTCHNWLVPVGWAATKKWQPFIGKGFNLSWRLVYWWWKKSSTIVGRHR